MSVLPRGEKTNNRGIVPQEYMRRFMKENNLCSDEKFFIYDTEDEFPLRDEYLISSKLELTKISEPYRYMGRLCVTKEVTYSVMWRLLTGRYMIKGGTKMEEVSKVSKCKDLLDRVNDIDQSIVYLNAKIDSMSGISGSGNKLLNSSSVEIKFDKIVNNYESTRNSSLCFKVDLGDQITMAVRDALISSMLASIEGLELERSNLIGKIKEAVVDLA